MDFDMQINSPATSVAMLDTMSYHDLESVKRQIEVFRQRILQLQNAQSFLLRLPGEIRNEIFRLSMFAELDSRKQCGRYSSIFRTPDFFNLNRQIRLECTGIWFSDILVWEEYTLSKWKALEMEEVKAMCVAKSEVGKLTLVTQTSHCDLGRTREAVEGSRSICPRKGLVRVRNREFTVGLRWWVW